MGEAEDVAPEEITGLLLRARAGDPTALDRVMPLVYEQLKRMARGRLRAERQEHSLDTTGLVHEAYLRLVDQRRVEWRDRGHFFRVAAMAMRRVLVDHARRHLASKRYGARQPVSLDAVDLPVDERAHALAEVDEALARLTVLDERLGRVVECRFFAGLTEEETAEALGVTPRTVRRDWVKAKGLLRETLTDR